MGFEVLLTAVVKKRAVHERLLGWHLRLEVTVITRHDHLGLMLLRLLATEVRRVARA